MSDHAAHHDSESHHIKVYLKVFGGLLVLTVLTVLVSLADLGPLSLPVAMAVAMVKATLVATFFMHLKDDERFNTFIFLAPTLFLALLFVYFYIDITGRDTIEAREGNAVYYNKKQDQFQRANPPPPPDPNAAHADH
jgi:cytochrome c oxidase subunit 4